MHIEKWISSLWHWLGIKGSLYQFPTFTGGNITGVAKIEELFLFAVTNLLIAGNVEIMY